MEEPWKILDTLISNKLTYLKDNNDISIDNLIYQFSGLRSLGLEGYIIVGI